MSAGGPDSDNNNGNSNKNKNNNNNNNKFSDNSCTAQAPASTANLGPGYDVFGLGIDALHDTVSITKIPETWSGRILINIRGDDNAGSSISANIPTKPENNSAGRVIKKMAEDFSIKHDMQVDILKEIPAGYGMGSSAASAAAAAIAFNRLYNLGLDHTKLIEYAAEGEIASAGTKHYDNVAGSVLGGFVIVRTFPRLEFIRLDPPDDLVLVICVPLIDVPKKKTEIARSVLPSEVPLKNVIHNVAGACTIVAGFALKDVQIIARGIDDAIVEPARKRLIPNFDVVKKNAIDAGALAATISGAGPSVISFLRTDARAEQVADAMSRGFKENGDDSITFICRPSGGARVITDSKN